MSVLRESSNLPLKKSKSGKVLSGLFAEFDVFNQNTRKYPRDIYESALDEIMPKIRGGRLLGECDHPDYDEVKLTNVSHVIRDCRVEGNKVHGTVELLDTPAGKIVQSLVESGIPIGISSRGVGNTKTTMDGTIVTDLKLITFDLVADPSFSGAVLSESIKLNLSNKLNSIEMELPLNESKDSDRIRNNINSIRESIINKVPDVTGELVESIGKLSMDLNESQSKYKDSLRRNKSLKSNMGKLQESYNKLYESNEKLKVSHKSNSTKLKENTSKFGKVVDNLENEVVQLRKELAIEKRGLSPVSVLPLLEGLETTKEIENKLYSIKSLGTRKRSIDKKDLESLTEGLSNPGVTSTLAKLVSSV